MLGHECWQMMTKQRALSKGVDLQRRRAPIYDQEDIAALRSVCQQSSAILDEIAPFIAPGVTTQALDDRIDTMMRDAGGVAATLGYKGYPASSCISVNHVVNHGIPSEAKRLQDGDIVNIDVTLLKDGWYGDNSRMYLVGDRCTVKAKKLVDITYQAMMAGIDQVRPGAELMEIGLAIQTIAHRAGFSVVEEYCGHGVGRAFHDAPMIMHYAVPTDRMRMEPGMVFTVEPMINAGKKGVKQLSDGWTVVTRDRSLSAQFEHTVVVTEDGHDILTLSPKGHTQPPYPL